MDLPVYDLALLFERLVEKLLNALATSAGLTVRLQHARSDALLDGDARVYRRIRPDIVVHAGHRPLAVVDAKYKPRYSTGGFDPPMSNRVSIEDAYQLFFYAERLRRLHSIAYPLPAYIVAPQLTDPASLPPPERRRIVWDDPTVGGQIGLRVVPVPLVSLLDTILAGASFLEAALTVPELASIVAAGTPSQAAAAIA